MFCADPKRPNRVAETGLQKIMISSTGRAHIGHQHSQRSGDDANDAPEAGSGKNRCRCSLYSLNR